MKSFANIQINDNLLKAGTRAKKLQQQEIKMAKENKIKKKIKKKIPDVKENISEVKESISVFDEKFFENMKEKYETSKDELLEIAQKTKGKIKKKPYESVAIAAGVGTVLGMGIGAGMYNSIQNKNKLNYNDYKKAFSRNSNLYYFSKILKNDVKKKPYESIGIAMGLGILIGAGINSFRECNEK